MDIKIVQHNLAILLLLIPFLVNAETTFLITDQAGKPLQDVVIEITSSTSTLVDDDNVAVMDQINKRFNPTLLVIQKGQMVDFPNSDNIRHHVYSFSKANTFELKLYADRPEKPIKFDNHGVVVLGCNIHDSMLGYIYVTNSPLTGVTNEEGKLRLSIPSDTVSEISLWHANQKQGPEYRHRVNISSDQLNAPDLSFTIETIPQEPRNSFRDVFNKS